MEVVEVEFMSLFEYLGKPAGSDLGKSVAAAAMAKKVGFTTKQVVTKYYTGKIMMYPVSFLKEYFTQNPQQPSVDQLPF